MCAYVCTCALCITPHTVPGQAGWIDEGVSQRGCGSRVAFTQPADCLYVCRVYECVSACATYVCVLFVDKHLLLLRLPAVDCCCFVSITLMRLLMPSSRATYIQYKREPSVYSYTQTHTHTQRVNNRHSYKTYSIDTHTRTQSHLTLNRSKAPVVRFQLGATSTIIKRLSTAI